MRLVCPACQACYDVPEAALSRPMIRCARCGHEWRPAAPRVLASFQSLAAEPKPIAPPPAAAGSHAVVAASAFSAFTPLSKPVSPSVGPVNPMAGLVASPTESAAPVLPSPAAPVGGAAFGWMISILMLLMLIWAAFLFRSQIMAAWPPSIRVYTALKGR